MDYDDDEFQGQNHQLAGEGRSKVSPVLHPYALPKFEFDDTLDGHLNFNSLVENEVFLGQEDNRWIEEYSRGNNGIEFNSGGVELRRNNVWSEATSSESVEMLLKSVGQEEKVVGKAIVEQLDPNICDETVTLTKAMDPKSQESQIPSGELDSVITNEKHNLSVLGEKVDSTFDDVILKEPSKDYSGSLENVGARVEEFNVIGLSKCASSDAAEESIQIKENKKYIPVDRDTVIVESCMYGAEKSLSFVANVEYVDKPSAETDNSFAENLSAETSSIPFSENPSAETSNLFSAKLSDENNTPFLENQSAETSIPFSENPSAENSTPFSENQPNETSILFSEKLPAEKSISFTENPSAKINIPFSKNLPTETSITFSKNPPTETSIPFSEKPSTQTSISFTEKPLAENNTPLSESPSQILKLKDPDSLKSNAGSLSRISPIKISVQENETVIEKDAQHIISDTSMMSAGNLPEKGCETSGSVQVDCKITSSEPDAIHLDQDDSFNEKGDAKSPLESNDIDFEVVRAVDSQKNVEPSLQGSKENTVTTNNFESDVSVRALIIDFLVRWGFWPIFL